MSALSLSMAQRGLWFCCLVLLVHACPVLTGTTFGQQGAAASDSSPVHDLPPVKVLFLGDQGHHVPAQRFEQIQPILAKRNIGLTYTESLSDMRLENLKQYDALILYANIESIDPQAEQGILDYVTQGGGFVPLHCASYCFQNSSKMVNLIGAQFKEHGTGVFRTDIQEGHPINQGFGGFESWDETYTHHLHNDENRTILSYRTDQRGREPWTWVRTEGKGRVFYTAWGHDQRTWSRTGFHNLLERGIRWAAGQEPALAGNYLAERPFPVAKTIGPAADVKPFEYIDVGAKIPNYTASDKWGTQGENLSLMQKPLPADESIKHFVVPAGFHVELFASEPDLGGKPISMAWDHRGRLWVCETVDYPNELQAPGSGRDRIRICEDTDGDWKADKFTVFAENLSIPSTLTFWRDGVIVQNGAETLYLKDTNQDDVADERTVVFTGWSLGDTHGGVSNFRYGLDNHIWGMQGYNYSEPSHAGKTAQGFRQGFFRFQADGSDLEFVRPTDNNTWGLGISEEGLIFGSTANRNPSVFMPIANRYYEKVAGWKASLTLTTIADSHLFKPVTDKVRQMDHHGGYTAGAGHALYTARQYPIDYWNRTAFVNGPTGHLVGLFVLQPSGAGFKSTSPTNLIASDDEWSAPVMSEVGPDGAMWMIDWYNYIIQHNPTPQGFQTGKGGAYETDLRDKVHGRIYRIVYDGEKIEPSLNLQDASTEQLVQALANPTMTWRLHAQRLLIEKNAVDAEAWLIQRVQDRSQDEIGLNVAAIHALWTLHGLGLISPQHPAVVSAVHAALTHPSPGVRRNAVQVLPQDWDAVTGLLDVNLLSDSDAQVRLAAFLALADSDQASGTVSSPAGAAIANAVCQSENYLDRWLLDGATAAAANHAEAFLIALAARPEVPGEVLPMCQVIAEHLARSNNDKQGVNLDRLVAELTKASPELLSAITRGWVAGWQTRGNVMLSDTLEANLVAVVERIPAAERGALLQVADRWGSRKLEAFAQQVVTQLLNVLDDESLPETERVAAAVKLISFRPELATTTEEILDRITPQTPPSLAVAWVTALGGMTDERLGEMLIASADAWSPVLRTAAFDVLLQRKPWTQSLLSSLESGTLQISDLSLEQNRALADLNDPAMKKQARLILQRGGALPNADRQAVLAQYRVATENAGDAANGKVIFKNVCAKCHRHAGEGAEIGPELTGMAVHPKEELLVHILDPNRSVESNFRMYNVQTIDGLVMAGMLSSESKTAIELVDSQGEKKTILREDIDAFRSSRISLMPEGFEKEITVPQMADLLAFMTKRGKYLALDLSKVATVASDRGMFFSGEADVERLIFSQWGEQQFQGVPFRVIDPQGGQVNNAVLLQGGPEGSLSAKMPTQVELPCETTARAIHFLGGVSGWGFPYGEEKSVSMIVRLQYQDGTTEDHPLQNGVHFADYIRRVDVPESEFAFAVRGQQVRYFAVIPGEPKAIQKLFLIKGPDTTAPVTMAITVEGS